MAAEHHAVSRIAGAIGEPARARILYCLMDRHARTSTELAVVAEVSPSTTSVHLNRLRKEGLVRVMSQGKHRYYSLNGDGVADVLEGLSVLAGGTRKAFVPGTPPRLRAARTCYDHIAGTLGVQLHDRMKAMGWVSADPRGPEPSYGLTAKGVRGFSEMGVDVGGLRASRRRLAYGCLDWSERRYHLGGAVGAAILELALRRKWVVQDLDGRALSVTAFGRRELHEHFGAKVWAQSPHQASL